MQPSSPFLEWLNKFKWLFIILLVLVVAAFFVFRASGKKTKVEVISVKIGDLTEAISTSGEIKADENSLLTFQSSGKVSWVRVKVGDNVKKGQPIAGLDTIALNAAYMQSLNNYRNYQANAQSVLDSVKDHSGDETYSQKATRTAAEVSRDNAYDSMLSARDALGNANIYAPFDGVVTSANPSAPGINISPLTSGYTIVNPSTVYFDAEVEETDLPNIKIGQKTYVNFDSYPDKKFEGTVTSIGFVAFVSATGGNAYAVRISLPDNSDMKFRVGMQGDAEIVLNKVAGVLKIPVASYFTENEENFVWKVESGKLKKTKIEIGKSSLDEVEVKSGISDGDVVVDQPSADLKDGQKVTT